VTGLFETLREGHARYREARLPEYRPLFKKLADTGQDPKALVVACSDSRVDPTLLFDQDPGDLFIVRNVANVVPPYEPGAGYHGTSAALEFGVKGLELSDIIVLGHAHCGGIQALIEMTDGEAPPGEFIGPWMSIAEQAALQAKEESTGEDRAVKTEQAVVRMSLKNLMTFPWVADRVTSGALTIHGFYFDIRDGSVMWLNSNTHQFENFT
jgi:carbonic anhydrase